MDWILGVLDQGERTADRTEGICECGSTSPVDADYIPPPTSNLGGGADMQQGWILAAWKKRGRTASEAVMSRRCGRCGRRKQRPRSARSPRTSRVQKPTRRQNLQVSEKICSLS